MRSFLLASFALLTMVVVGCEPAAETPKPPAEKPAEVKPAEAPKAPEVKPEDKMAPTTTPTPAPVEAPKAPETKPETPK